MPKWSAADVIAGRTGAVLGRGTLLKDDHFPGCQNKRLTDQLEGAPNFRKVPGLNVYGVAIPTVGGLRRVLDAVGGKLRRMLWHSMREEPLVYVNGAPYVLREVERPFSNLEMTGITRERVEAMEERLRDEVLAEAGRYDGRVLVSEELDNGEVVDTWLVVQAVQTPVEVYAAFAAEGYQLSYVRIPITDEKAPKCQDCDAIAGRCVAADSDTALIFNCQMGRGRTTTAMIVAALVRSRLYPAEQAVTDLTVPPPSAASDDDRLMLQGDYAVVRSLVRVVEGGKEAKAAADRMIDCCAHMQNLREAILGYRRALGQEADEKRREAALLRGVEYLERYFTLIAFAAYVQDSGPGLEVSFQAWMDRRPELQSILRRLLWRNPMGALMPPTAPGAVVSAEVSQTTTTPDGGEAAEAVLASRAGSVLGAHCVLKQEPYPGVQSTQLPVLHDGAPNFRQAASYPVYGVAISTLQGIHATLDAIGVTAGGAKSVHVYNLREEPCIFLGDSPFVLREATRPLANLCEYSGIDSSRLELLETRLKQDVLSEIERYKAVLVTRELPDGQLVDVWISVPPLAVKTPREVYDDLAQAGFSLRYLRVPVTHTRAPKGRDFDALAHAIACSPPGTAHLFNCQAGHGRTTTAMVVAVLCLRAMAGEHIGTISRRSEDDDATGQWIVVSRLLLLLQGGHEAKAELDAVIDLCSAVVNLRAGIREGDFMELDQSAKQLSHDRVLSRGLADRLKLLDLYLCLVAFTAWLRLGKPAHCYKTWRKQRPEVHELRGFIRRNPMAALELSRPANSNILQSSLPDAHMAHTHRTGTVLAPTTMLKRHFLHIDPPELENLNSDILDDFDAVSGGVQENATKSTLPRLCAATGGIPVTGFATGRVSLFRQWLSDVADVGPHGIGPCVWLTDLREELVVYIDDQPFSLRESHRPMKSIKMASIPGPAVEELEARLKCDVLAEAAACGNRIMVHREAAPEMSASLHNAGNVDDALGSAVVPYWTPVDERNVVTMREICEQLKEEGFRLKYQRVPISRSRISLREKANDLDRLLTIIEQAARTEDMALAIVSHTGVGTAGYAMAISCSFLLSRQHGAVRISVPQYPAPLSPVPGSPDTRSFWEGNDEPRDIASLIRVLKHGAAAKELADRALDACSVACQTMDDELRAFLVLATSFIIGRHTAAAEGRSDSMVGNGAFVQFYRDRAELEFILSHLKKQTTPV